MCRKRCRRLLRNKRKARQSFAGKKRARRTKLSLAKTAKNGVTSSTPTAKRSGNIPKPASTKKKARNTNSKVVQFCLDNLRGRTKHPAVKKTFFFCAIF